MSPKIDRPEKTARVLRAGANLTRERRILAQLPPGPVKHKPPAALPIRLSLPPDALVWFALTVLPQSERIALGQLRMRGFDAFLPVERVEAKLNRRQRFRRVERERPMLPSLVLVGFPKGEGVPWLEVWDVPRVTGVIGMGDRPAPLPLHNVVTLMLMSGARSRTRVWIPAPGDVVEVTAGPFTGFEGKVMALRDRKARVRLFDTGSGALAKMSGELSVDENDLVEANFATG